MARGGYRPGAGRPKSAAGDSKTKAELPEKPEDTGGDTNFSPLDYMLHVMNSSSAEDDRRDRMAIAAAPYMHPKKGDVGKKEQVKDAAEQVASGRFGLRKPGQLKSVK